MIDQIAYWNGPAGAGLTGVGEGYPAWAGRGHSDRSKLIRQCTQLTRLGQPSALSRQCEIRPA
jgi:hypothetical protein